jgi:hypothetical protein
MFSNYQIQTAKMALPSTNEEQATDYACMLGGRRVARFRRWLTPAIGFIGRAGLGIEDGRQRDCDWRTRFYSECSPQRDEPEEGERIGEERRRLRGIEAWQLEVFGARFDP